MVKFRIRPIFKDIFTTFTAEIIVLAGFIFFYRLIAKTFGPVGVGEYSLIRKTASLFQPLLILGLGIGIPRYVAMSRDMDERASYIRAALFVSMLLTVAFLVLVNLFRYPFVRLIFGNYDYIKLILPFSFFLLGLVLHVMVYAYLRGRMFVKTFNFLQIVNLALVPIFILIFFKNLHIETVVTFIGITTFLVALVFFLFFIREFFGPVKRRQFGGLLKEMLGYSILRIPSTFGLMGIFSLSPILAIHFSSIQNVGYLSVSQSLLTGICGMTAPLGIILLPRVSRLIKDGVQETIKENLDLLIAAIVQCSVFMFFQLLIFSDVIIKYWLGPDFFDAVPVMRVVLVSTVFYAFYIAIRDILDASKFRPINTINIFISFGIFLAAAGVLLFLIKTFVPIIGLSIAFSSSLICLGILTYLSVRKIYPQKFLKDLSYLGISLAINFLLAGVAVLAKPFITSRFYFLFVFELGLVIIYLVILWLIKTEWVKKALVFKKHE